MSKRNLCAVLHGAGDLRVVERPTPQPADNEVQVAIRSVGVCGSDMSLYRTAVIGPCSLRSPMTLGHEACGVVSSLGSNVTQLAIGDRVALSPIEGCGRCRVCSEGHHNLCPHVRMMATPPTDGSLANFVVWPASLCYKLPDTMTWEEGALVQPMTLALYGCQRAGVKPGHRLLVCGAGPLGMMMVMAAKDIGVSSICVTDLSDDRLQFLKTTTGCLVTRADDDAASDVADRVMSLLGREADVTIECSGAPSAVRVGIYVPRRYRPNCVTQG
ncbi:sorbitol dehydrogenase-like isoform X2 [Babylonia areolata]|uniref:sorbitol dehydrogenase-like isoform X2 n=1 Tax=Babylonia areolata TaxID=304850 RepID=UPI003FD5DE62